MSEPVVGRAAGAPLLADGTAADALAGRLPKFTHCLRMFGRFGMFEFAHESVPDETSGYCLDDNARALIVAVLALGLNPDDADATAILRASLRFVEEAQRPDGAFHNRRSPEGAFTDEIGSPESIGRAAWACGIALRLCPHGVWCEAAKRVLARALPHLYGLEGVKSQAYALLGLCHTPPSVLPVRRELERLAEGLALTFERNATVDWPWWEAELSWGNARVPEAMLRAYLMTGQARYLEIGWRALEFLASVTQPAKTHVPIGNYGWYPRGGERAIYDQQPIETAGMVDMWLAAADARADRTLRDRALAAFEWFLGNNTEALMVAEPSTGGSHDGLKRGCLNLNMGAESTLSYLQAHLSIAHAFRQ